MQKQGLHGKHCDKYLVSEGRICDRPAEVCNLGKYRCAEHDPLRVPFVGEYDEPPRYRHLDKGGKPGDRVVFLNPRPVERDA